MHCTHYIHCPNSALLQEGVSGTETNIGRSRGTAVDHLVVAVVEVVKTCSEGPHTGVDQGMDTGKISGDHRGDLPGEN